MPQQRVKQFPDKNLIISFKKFFYEACKEEVSMKCSSVRNHIKSYKHKSIREKLACKETQAKDIATSLTKHNEEVHLKGEMLPEQQQVFRVKVVTVFLLAAVPLNKLACFRDVLEGGAYRLTDRQNMSDLVPFILKQEQKLFREEINGKYVSVILDGITRLGEALAIVLHVVGKGWTID